MARMVSPGSDSFGEQAGTRPAGRTLSPDVSPRPGGSVPVPSLPPLTAQAERLIELGVHELAAVPATELRAAAASEAPGPLLVIHPDRAPASVLAPLVRHRDKPGFVVVDMADVDDFQPVAPESIPAAPVYLADDVARGDEFANWSPDEAGPALAAADRSPLLLTEGLYWLLQQPESLERNHCFMTIGS